MSEKTKRDAPTLQQMAMVISVLLFASIYLWGFASGIMQMAKSETTWAQKSQ